MIGCEGIAVPSKFSGAGLSCTLPPDTPTENSLKYQRWAGAQILRWCQRGYASRLHSCRRPSLGLRRKSHYSLNLHLPTLSARGTRICWSCADFKIAATCDGFFSLLLSISFESQEP